MYTFGVCLAVSDSALYLATFRESGTEASWDGRASSKKGSPRPTGTVLLDDHYSLSCPYHDLNLYGGCFVGGRLPELDAKLTPKRVIQVIQLGRLTGAYKLLGS